MQIKTIRTRIDSATTFDKEVNDALKDGWILKKREVIVPSQPRDGEHYFHITLYAELEKA